MTPRKRTSPGPVTAYTAGRILILRRKRGLQQAQLAEAVTALGRRMTMFTVSDIENGKRLVDVEELCALATALGVAPAELLPENPPRDDG